MALTWFQLYMEGLPAGSSLSTPTTAPAARSGGKPAVLMRVGVVASLVAHVAASLHQPPPSSLMTHLHACRITPGESTVAYHLCQCFAMPQRLSICLTARHCASHHTLDGSLVPSILFGCLSMSLPCMQLPGPAALAYTIFREAKTRGELR